MALSDEERARLRALGRARAATLPALSPEAYRHIAELLRQPLSQFLSAKRAAARTGSIERTRRSGQPANCPHGGDGRPGHAEG